MKGKGYWDKIKLGWTTEKKLRKRQKHLADFRLRGTYGPASDVRRIDPISDKVLEIIARRGNDYGV